MNDSTLIAVFRHGNTCYRQGNGEVSVSYADDLCMPTEPDPLWGKIISESHVRFSAGGILPHFKEGAPTRITSSPTGRTVSTAKCIYRRCLPYGIAFRDHQSRWPIEIDPDLGEVQGFDWPLYSALVKGGSITRPLPCTLDAALTNPYDLDDTDYFFADMMHRLNLRTFPKEVTRTITSIESPHSCIARFRRAIKAAAANRLIRQWIFVTHAGITEWPARVFSRNKVRDLPRGWWILIRATPEKAHVIAMRGIASGDSETDLLTTNWLDYQPKF